MKETYTSISYPFFEQDLIRIDQDLYLEPINQSMLKPLYKAMAKDREYLSEFLPWAKSQTQESLQKFIDISIANREQKREFVYIIRKNKDILGCISLINYNPSCFGLPGHTNVGYYLFSEFQGHGYIKKALLALTSLYYVNNNINRFQIEIQGHNLKSIHVAESIGAKFEGVARKLRNYENCHVYSYILPDDFISHNQQLEQNAKTTHNHPLDVVDLDSSHLANNPNDLDQDLPEGNVEGFGDLDIILEADQGQSKTVDLDTLPNEGVEDLVNIDLATVTSQAITNAPNSGAMFAADQQQSQAHANAQATEQSNTQNSEQDHNTPADISGNSPAQMANSTTTEPTNDLALDSELTTNPSTNPVFEQQASKVASTETLGVDSTLNPNSAELTTAQPSSSQPSSSVNEDVTNASSIDNIASTINVTSITNEGYASENATDLNTSTPVATVSANPNDLTHSTANNTVEQVNDLTAELESELAQASVNDLTHVETAEINSASSVQANQTATVNDLDQMVNTHSSEQVNDLSDDLTTTANPHLSNDVNNDISNGISHNMTNDMNNDINANSKINVDTNTDLNTTLSSELPNFQRVDTLEAEDFALKSESVVSDFDDITNNLQAQVESQIMTGEDLGIHEVTQVLDHKAQEQQQSYYDASQNDLDDLTNDQSLLTDSVNDLELNSPSEPASKSKRNCNDLLVNDYSVDNDGSVLDMLIPTEASLKTASLTKNKDSSEPKTKTKNSAKFFSSVETVTPTTPVGSTECQNQVTSDPTVKPSRGKKTVKSKDNTHVYGTRTLNPKPSIDPSKRTKPVSTSSDFAPVPQAIWTADLVHELDHNLDQIARQTSQLKLSLEVIDTETNNLNFSTQELRLQHSQLQQELKLLEKTVNLTNMSNSQLKK